MFTCTHGSTTLCCNKARTSGCICQTLLWILQSVISCLSFLLQLQCHLNQNNKMEGVVYSNRSIFKMIDMYIYAAGAKSCTLKIQNLFLSFSIVHDVFLHLQSVWHVWKMHSAVAELVHSLFCQEHHSELLLFLRFFNRSHLIKA